MREGICWWVGAGASGWNVVLGAAEPAPLACRATRSRAGMRCADEGRFRYQKVQRRKTSAVTGNGYFDSEPMPFKACPRLGGRRYPTLGWRSKAPLQYLAARHVAAGRYVAFSRSQFFRQRACIQQTNNADCGPPIRWAASAGGANPGARSLVGHRILQRNEAKQIYIILYINFLLFFIIFSLNK